MNNIFIVENLQVNKSPLEIFFSEENMLFHIKSVLFPLEKKKMPAIFSTFYFLTCFLSFFHFISHYLRAWNRLKVSLRILMYDDVYTKRNSWYQINM